MKEKYNDLECRWQRAACWFDAWVIALVITAGLTLTAAYLGEWP